MTASAAAGVRTHKTAQDTVCGAAASGRPDPAMNLTCAQPGHGSSSLCLAKEGHISEYYWLLVFLLFFCSSPKRAESSAVSPAKFISF